ncbi:FtsX-like permease family protein [Enterococcus sp. BWM-S5]|uniref:FtsX-like permease family protein n=1 Tax=Enterococcus larvae TaxID=2794352 RepID=A0ABS4CGU2_9ENTE|nr:FtsX-like permease family protein [Enterococcus larvae]MBP1045767.1 FtsX-like permease family protein [Enterococcus larvae]
MRILVKYILKSMIKNKGRLLMLIVSIALSTGLFIGSQKAFETVMDSQKKIQMEAFEGKEVSITKNDYSSGAGIDPNELNFVKMKNEVPEILLQKIKLKNSKADFDTSLTLRGRQEKDFPKKAVFTEIQETDWSKDSISISQRASKELKLKLGDTITIPINDKDQELKVGAIAQNQGMFYNDTRGNYTILFEKEYLTDISGSDYTVVFVETDKASVVNAIKAFNKENADYTAAEVYDSGQMEQIVNQITMVITFMFLMVVLASILIINGAFRLTITERMNTVGTFLSQGATHGQIRLLFLAESGIYGFVGGVLGVLIGYGLTVIINRVSSPLAEYDIYEAVVFSPTLILTGLIFSIGLSLLAVLIPVVKLKRYSVKEVILNEFAVEKKVKWSSFFVGVLLMVVSFVGYFLFKEQVIVVVILLALVFIAFLLIYPKLTEKMMNGLFSGLKNKLSLLALSAQNMGTSKIIRSNITLFTVGLMVMLLINGIENSMRNTMTSVYAGYHYDVNIQVPANGLSSQQEEVTERLQETGLIESNFHSEILTNIKIDDYAYNLIAFDDPTAYRNYYAYIDWQDKSFDKVFEQLGDGSNSFMTTYSYAEKLNLKVGDTISFPFGNEQKDMKLVGLYKNKSSFNYFLLNLDNIPENLRASTTTNYYFNSTKGQKETQKLLKKELNDYTADVYTKDEQTQQNTEQNELMISIFQAFSLMTIIIGSFGIISNTTISFLQRKKDFALYASLGMSQGQLTGMLLYEGILTVLATFIIGVPLTFAEAHLVEKVMGQLMETDFPIRINVGYLPIVFVLLWLIVILSSIPALWKLRKLTIIEELKYE